MAICALTGKGRMNGNKVSHSNIKTKRTTKPNIQSKRIFDSETGRWIRLKISTSALRTLAKKSLASFCR